MGEKDGARGPFGVFDLHCDTLDALALAEGGAGARLGLSWHDVEGDLAHNNLALAADRMAPMRWCQCYAVFLPDELAAGVTPLEFYRTVVAYFKGQASAADGPVRQVRDARDIDATLDAGGVAALLTVENGSVLDSGLEVADGLADDGVKMLTLTWNGRNAIGSGNDGTSGLTAFGERAVAALEERGIVVDVSHLNEAGFWDVARVARRPFAASHSNARAVCDHARNLTDDQFRAIAAAGGIVGLNYYRSFVTRRHGAHGEAAESGEVTFEELMAHVEHWLDLGGEGVVALGSDYDGSRVPAWLDGCERVPAFHERVVRELGQDLADRLFFSNARDFFVRHEEARA
jgi:membrane dipeptidase